MKKYNIAEIITQCLGLIIYVIVLIFNQNKDNQIYFNYVTSLIYFGYVIVTIHIIFILIKQIKLKSYLGSRYDSQFSFYAVICFGFIHILLIYYISEDVLIKFLPIFILLIPFIYSLFITLGIIFEKRDKKLAKNIKLNK